MISLILCEQNGRRGGLCDKVTQARRVMRYNKSKTNLSWTGVFAMFNFFGRETVKSVHVNDLEKLIGAIELIDIREPYEFAGGSIKTAKNIPMGELLAAPEKYITKDKTYYIVCQSGGRSAQAASVLAKQGYDVVNVSGGVGSYAGAQRT